jgi:hypothetical protein
MLASIKDAYDTLKQLQHQKVQQIINRIDLNLLGKLSLFLKKFLDTRTALSGESQITLPLVIPAKLELKHFIATSFLPEEVKTNFQIALEQKMSITIHHKAATFLYAFYYHQKRNVELFSANDEYQIFSLFELITEKSSLEQTKFSPRQTSTPNPEVNAHPSFILSQVETINIQNDILEANKSDLQKEVDNYNNKIHFKPHHLTSTCSLFKFWNEQQPFYPLLCQCARYLFGIPATQNSTERLNSLAGSIVTDKRSNLLPTSVNSLVFINKNHKFGISRAH